MSYPKVFAGEVYLERTVVTVGYLDTSRKTALENYWRADPLDEDRVKVTLLDINDEPTDLWEIVSRREFHQRFMHQPGYWNKTKGNKQRLAEVIIDRADEHYNKKEYLSAEYEYKNALRLDEESVRANFGLGLTYMAQGEIEKARDVFFRLANIQAVYSPQHKHLFNEFGIQLRRSGLYNEAMEHYHRALTIVGSDENLWFNLGRALHEDGHRPDLARRAMDKALALNPAMLEARAYINRFMTDPAQGDEPATAATEQGELAR